MSLHILTVTSQTYEQITIFRKYCRWYKSLLLRVSMNSHCLTGVWKGFFMILFIDLKRTIFFWKKLRVCYHSTAMNCRNLIYAIGWFNLCVVCALIQLSFGKASNFSRCWFPAIYNFGDSNSDTGAVSAAFTGVKPPNGISFFGSLSGRASDGRLIIDYISK